MKPLEANNFIKQKLMNMNNIRKGKKYHSLNQKDLE